MTPWASVSLISAVLVLGAIATLVRNRPPRSLLPALPAVLAASLVFELGDLAAQLGYHTSLRWVGVSITYTGIILLGPFWFWLALRISEMRGMRPKWLCHSWIPAAPIAVASLCLVALHTNPWHGQFITLAEGRNDYHFFWYVQATIGYGTGAAALVIYSWMALRARVSSARRQALVLVVGSSLTPALNAVYVSLPFPLPFDTTSIGVAVTSALIVASIRRRELYSVSVSSLGEMLDGDGDSVLLLDEDGLLASANPAAKRMFGPLVGYVGVDVLEGLSGVLREPETRDRPSPEALREHILGVSRAHDAIYRLGERWLRIEATRVRDSSGRAIGVLVRARDETELRRATHAAAEQAAALEAVFAATGEGICVSDTNGTVRYANGRLPEILGLERIETGMELTGLMEELLPLLAEPDTFVSTLQITRSKPSAVVRDSFTMADGRMIERTSLPLEHGGVVHGRVWRIADVTEQRRSEEALNNAQKLESLGLMAGGVAHDFNNLLVSVLGNADLALMELPEPSELRPLLEDIRRAAERGSDLTTALLSYAGRSRGASEFLDLSEVTREMVELMRVSMPPNVTLGLDLARWLPGVQGEATQLRQVVMNLLINASDAMSQDGGRLGVETGVARLSEEDLAGLHFSGDARAGEFVLVRVADGGCGMDESTRSRVFDPFFTTKQHGRGLGLAATLGVVKAHGGALGLVSEIGEGSTFTVYLPAGEERPQLRLAASEDTAAGWRSHGRILVADDEDSVRRVARRVLEGAGFEVVDARDGAEALSLWEEHHGDFRAVLLDLSMPVMSGEEALRELRRLEPKVPVLIASGYASDEIVLDEYGPETEFLPKPYRRDSLLSALRALLAE